MPEDNLEVEFYAILESEGERYIKYRGCTYFVDDDIIHPYRIAEVCWCTMLLSEWLSERQQPMFGLDVLTEFASNCQQYISDETEYSVSEYINESIACATHLDIESVDRDTPCGEYWCPTPYALAA